MSLTQGLFSLNQSMQRPTQLSQNQQGLFEALGKSLAPPPEIDLSDPESIRIAAEKALNEGETGKGTRLLQTAQDIEQKQKTAKRKANYSAYEQAVRAGKKTEFENSMIQSGSADELAAIQRAYMQNELLEMEYGNAQEAQKIKGLTREYFGAKEPEARKAVLQSMRDQGFGSEAQQIIVKEAEAEADRLNAQINLSKAKFDQAARQIKALPVPTRQEDRDRIRSQIPEQYRGLYDQQAAAVMKSQKELVQAQKALEESAPLSKAFVEAAGMDYEDYLSDLKQTPYRINALAIEQFKKRQKDEVVYKLPSGPEYEQLSSLFDKMNTVKKDWWPDGEVMDSERKEEVVQATFATMQRENVDGLTAMQMVMQSAPQQTSNDPIAAALQQLIAEEQARNKE